MSFNNRQRSECEGSVVCKNVGEFLCAIVRTRGWKLEREKKAARPLIIFLPISCNRFARYAGRVNFFFLFVVELFMIEHCARGYAENTVRSDTCSLSGFQSMPSLDAHSFTHYTNIWFAAKYSLLRCITLNARSIEYINFSNWCHCVFFERMFQKQKIH